MLFALQNFSNNNTFQTTFYRFYFIYRFNF